MSNFYNRKSKKSKKWIYIFLALFLTTLWYQRALHKPVESTATKDVQIIVSSGDRTQTVIEKLDEKNLIRSPLALKIYLKLHKLSTEVKAGNYRMTKSMNALEIVEVLLKGSEQEVIITIPEGWTTLQIGQYLESLGLFFSAEEFVAAATMDDDWRAYDFLADLPNGESLEGYLFPDTYQVFYDSDPLPIIIRMVNNFKAKVSPEILAEIKDQKRTLKDVITLASIVQKESPIKDMPIISGIFWQRLLDHYPLQSDATVNYVLGTSNLQPSFDDTKVDNPYNTYRNIGLPPGPISNPGIEAIEAAINPQSSPYYFYLSKPNGETVFSVTYEEHLANKAKYLD